MLALTHRLKNACQMKKKKREFFLWNSLQFQSIKWIKVGNNSICAETLLPLSLCHHRYRQRGWVVTKKEDNLQNLLHA